MANLTGVFADIGNLIPSQGDLLNSIIAATAGTVVISGMKSEEGQNALDPLHLFHKPATPTSPATTGAVQGPGVMKMSQFLTLTPDQQKLISTMGYTVIPG